MVVVLLVVACDFDVARRSQHVLHLRHPPTSSASAPPPPPRNPIRTATASAAPTSRACPKQRVCGWPYAVVDLPLHTTPPADPIRIPPWPRHAGLAPIHANGQNRRGSSRAWLGPSTSEQMPSSASLATTSARNPATPSARRPLPRPRDTDSYRTRTARKAKIPFARGSWWPSNE